MFTRKVKRALTAILAVMILVGALPLTAFAGAVFNIYIDGAPANFYDVLGAKDVMVEAKEFAEKFGFPITETNDEVISFLVKKGYICPDGDATADSRLLLYFTFDAENSWNSGLWHDESGDGHNVYSTDFLAEEAGEDYKYYAVALKFGDDVYVPLKLACKLLDYPYTELGTRDETSIYIDRSVSHWFESTEKTAADKPASWAAEKINAAIKNGLVTGEMNKTFQSATTRAEFCRLAMRFIEVYYGSPTANVLNERGLSAKTFADTSDPAIGAAAALGITSGTDTAKNLFSPDIQLTREQAAAMLNNVLIAIGMKVSAPAVEWTDTKEISSWAKSAADIMYVSKVMGGTSTTALVFSPKSPYTHEQAIATLQNLWEYVKTQSAEGSKPTADVVASVVSSSNGSKFLLQIEPIADTTGWIAVSNRSELEAIRADLKGNYYLTADIDLQGEDWIPIGDQINLFRGMFDGQGFVIKNMTIDGSFGSHNNPGFVGLFGCVGDGGAILNVGVENGRITTRNDGDYKGNTVGGITGRVDSATIYNCFFSGSIIAEGTGCGLDVGGIAGLITDRGTLSRIESCVNYGNITAKSDRMAFLGGIAGDVLSFETIIKECNNLGALYVDSSGVNSAVGGIVGIASSLSSITISYCKNNGDIKAKLVTPNADGIVGNVFDGDVEISNCHNTGTIALL